MKKKMWVRLFLQIAAIFVAFIVILSVANSTLLLNYYIYKEKHEMKAIATKIDEVDLYGADVLSELSEAISSGNYTLKISDSFGNTLFSSFDSPVADYKGTFDPNSGAIPGNNDGNSGDGFSISDKNNRKIIRYSYTLSGGEHLVLSVQMSLLKNSARVANEFMFFIALGCLIIALIWVLVLSKGIAKPIGQMKEITCDMAKLDFTRKLEIESQDEIGELAAAINVLSANLDDTLKDLNRKNARLRDEIEAERRLDKMRRGFVANVSHELKTPIAIIGGYAEGLKLNINSETDRAEYADVIIDESNRMNELVVSLLELSRLESGQIAINPVNYNIAEQTREFVTRMGAKFRAAGAEVECELPQNIEVVADTARMAQVLQNYLNNAASHVKSGGKIRIWSEQTDGDYTKVCVYNDGNSIEKQNMENIWVSFWRGEESHKRDSDRFGLGLSIVKAIIEIHKFSCGVYNSENGVVFWFTAKNSRRITEKDTENTPGTEKAEQTI